MLLYHIIVFATIHYVAGDDPGCTIKVNLSTPYFALFLKNRPTPEILDPTEKYLYRIKSGDKFKISCADRPFRKLPFLREIIVTCVEGITVRVSSPSHDFTTEIWNFDCDDFPTITYRRTGSTCNGDSEIIYIGYDTEGGFLKMYSVCYDFTQRRTVYAMCPYAPMSAYGDRRILTNPTAIFDDLYPFPVDLRTIIIRQLATLKSILGPGSFFDSCDPSSLDAINYKWEYVSLVPREHYVLSGEQEVTNHILNKIPIWVAIEQQDWNVLEDHLYRFLTSQQRSYMVAAGGYGIATLPNASGVPTELYQYVDDDGNRYSPVPAYIWKIVYDTETKTGTAFVTINNPFLDQDRIESMIFCKNICHRISWIKNIDKRFSRYPKQLFCCDMQDFLERTGIENMFSKNPPRAYSDIINALHLKIPPKKKFNFTYQAYFFCNDLRKQGDGELTNSDNNTSASSTNDSS